MNSVPTPPEDAALAARIGAPVVSTAGDVAQMGLLPCLAPMMKVAGAQAIAMRLLSSAGDQLQMVGACGLPAGVLGSEHSVASSCGVCGAALVEGKPSSVQDLRHCALHNEDTNFGHESRQIVAVPLKGGDRNVGVLTFFFDDALAIDADKTALLECLGTLVGVALGNAAHVHDDLGAALRDQRQALAAEVHDSVAQTLSFVKMRLPLLQDAIRTQDEGTALRYCEDLRKAVGSAHTNLRQLLTGFRVAEVPQGLKHALRSSILVFSQRTRVPLEFDDRAPDLSLSAAQESQVFHIVQEALANIAKHASARQVWLCIARSDGRVEVAIEDDGCGITLDQDIAGEHHFGLDIMRDRAARLGGHLEIGPRDGGGTCVCLSFPLAAVPAARA